MKLFLVLYLTTLALAQTPCDNIRTRAQWGSRQTTLTNMPNLPPSGFAIHHTAGNRCTSQAACDAEMRSIQNFHINSNRWADIGYNFCIGDPGVVYEGRGFDRQGAHAVGFNARALGHCFFGTHTSILPTPAALANTQSFINCARARGFLASNYWVSTHRGDRQSNTECPGQALQNQVATWPRFVAQP